MRRHELTDGQWALIEDMFPENGQGPGRPWKDHRRMVDAGGRKEPRPVLIRIKPSGPRKCLQVVEDRRNGRKTLQRVVATLRRLPDAKRRTNVGP